jgi:hypothetical protein
MALAAMGVTVLCAVAPGLAQDRPHEQTGPFVDLDWNVGLRGSYSNDSVSGVTLEGIVAPDVTFTRQGERDQTSLKVGGAFGIEADKTMRLEDAHVDATSTYLLDSATRLDGALGLRLTQDKPGDPSLPTGTKIPPLMFTGTAEGKVTRNLGRFDLVGSLSGERFLEGQTVLNNGTTVSNVDQNFWSGAGELRLGFELTPVTSVFVDGSAGIQKYDAPNPGLLRFFDNRGYTLRGGVSYKVPDFIEAEVSAGRTWLDYTDPALTDAAGWVFDSSVSFTPDETTTLSAALDTSLMPSDAVDGDTDAAYALTSTARYRVNPWLTLRGTAGANFTRTLGSGDTDWGYGVGAGLDWSTSRHVVWSADYLFTHDDSTIDGLSDTHAVTVGVVFKK